MKHAAAGLEKIVVHTLRKAPSGDAPILAWPLACGSTVAGRTRAVNYVTGILQVEVPDAAWRKELQALAPQYLAVVNRYLGGSVKRIEFVVSGIKTGGRDSHSVTSRAVATGDAGTRSTRT